VAEVVEDEDGRGGVGSVEDVDWVFEWRVEGVVGGAVVGVVVIVIEQRGHLEAHADDSPSIFTLLLLLLAATSDSPSIGAIVLEICRQIPHVIDPGIDETKVRFVQSRFDHVEVDIVKSRQDESASHVDGRQRHILVVVVVTGGAV